MDPNVRMYKVVEGQIAELVPGPATVVDGKPTKTWVVRRWLRKRDRMKFAAHPNCVRANEGRVGEGIVK